MIIWYWTLSRREVFRVNPIFVVIIAFWWRLWVWCVTDFIFCQYWDVFKWNFFCLHVVYRCLQLDVLELFHNAIFSRVELCHFLAWLQLLGWFILLFFLGLLDFFVHQLYNIVQLIEVKFVIVVEKLIILCFNFSLTFLPFDGLSFLKLEEPFLKSSHIHTIFLWHGLRASDVMWTFGRWIFILCGRFIFFIKTFFKVANVQKIVTFRRKFDIKALDRLNNVVFMIINFLVNAFDSIDFKAFLLIGCVCIILSCLDLFLIILLWF